MDNAQLTRKQKEFFEYIVNYRNENDIWPTYREIADEFGFKSPNSVTQNLQALLNKGYLIRGDDNEYEINPRFDDGYSNQNSSGIPIRGIIAAGLLQEAVEADLGNIGMQKLFPHLDKMFALRVSGSSMSDAGINDGDFVLLVDNDISNGDIGAVMYNGETTLKRVFFSTDGLRLEPANESYSDIVIKPDIFEEVKIVGRYVGHVNRNGFFRSTDH
jgi:repressor LexA